MFNSNQARRFQKRMISMEESIKDIGDGLIKMYGQVIPYLEQLSDELEADTEASEQRTRHGRDFKPSRKSMKLNEEIAACDILVDQIDNLASDIGVDLEPQDPIELAEEEEEEMEA